MFFDWFQRRRRRRWLSLPEPNAWADWLRSNVWQHQYLNVEQRAKVHRVVRILFHEKRWEGGGGLAVTDEMRVTIAGQAALATLGFEKPYYFDRLQTLIVYAGAFRSRPGAGNQLLLGELGQPHQDFGTRTGEAWQSGPIILSWDAVLHEGRHARPGRNVVLHEFAHHMDGLNGVTDGAPPMTDYEFEKKWYRVTDAEYQELLRLAHHRQPTLLDHYGATNHAEFFAVSTECFFTQPHQLAAEHHKLYAVLTRLFGQDPREWLPDAREKATG